MKTIKELIHEYHLTQKQDLLSDILYALGNAQLWVPVSAQMDDNDKQQFINALEGGALTTKEDMYLQPDFLRAGQEFFFPLFVEKEDSPEEYRNHFSWINMSLNQAASFTLKEKKLSGIVVNGFTDPFIISKDFLEYLSNKMNSHVVPKGTEVAFSALGNDDESLQILSAINKFADEDKIFGVRKIYAVVFIRENETSYLVMVDAASQDYESIFRKLNTAFMKVGKLKYPVDFCPWSQNMMSEMESCGIIPAWNWMKP